MYARGEKWLTLTRLSSNCKWLEEKKVAFTIKRSTETSAKNVSAFQKICKNVVDVTPESRTALAAHRRWTLSGRPSVLHVYLSGGNMIRPVCCKLSLNCFLYRKALLVVSMGLWIRAIGLRPGIQLEMDLQHPAQFACSL